jgi:hypothetical protein
MVLQAEEEEESKSRSLMLELKNGGGKFHGEEFRISDTSVLEGEL